MSEDYLTYYGVLGMKWGVRRHHSAPLNRYKKKRPRKEEIEWNGKYKK